MASTTPPAGRLKKSTLLYFGLPDYAVYLAAIPVSLYIPMVTWIQQRVPKEKMGRVMSVIMLASQGLFPISAAADGVLAGWDLRLLLGAAGSLMLIISLIGACIGPIRRMGYQAPV